MNRSTPGLPVHHQLPEFTETRVHQVSDAIQPSHPLSSPCHPAFNLSQHECLPMNQPISKNFLQFVVIYTVKAFSVVYEAEVNVFLEFSSFFYDPMDVGNLISGSCAFSKSSLYIWKVSVYTLLKPSLKDIEHYSTWNEWNYTVVWTFFGIALLWDWN